VSPLRAGILSLTLIGIGTWLAFGGNPFASGFELRAVVRGAPEVHTRTPVRIAGVEAGRVTKVERGPGDAATITMELDEGALPVHRDATLKVRPRIFLEGNFFVDLRPGSPGAEELEEGATLPPGQTAVAVQLDQVLSTLERSTRDDLRRVVRELAIALDGGGAEALRGSFPYWPPAFRSGALAAEAARGRRDGDLAGFVRDGARVADALDRGERLADLVTGLNVSLRTLALRREPLGRSLDELDGLLGEAGPALVAIERTLPPARALAREIRPALRAAPETLRLANPVLDQARGLLGPHELPPLLRTADPTIADLARLEPQLQELLALVTPVTECLRRNAVPTLKKPVEDPPLSTGQPVYRELLSGLVGLASASQNFDGNGPAVRYHAGFGDEMVSLGESTLQQPIVGLTSERMIGSRPRYTGKTPPFRPDVPCVSQDPPDLRADTGPAPRTRRISP
jgi:phospholipid/cholesterol/gamma-HCH transport system substrate-binding protein